MPRYLYVKIRVSIWILGLVGVAGFEPTASTSQMWRATNCATPRYSFLLFFTTARGALPVAMCRAAAALARPCIARMAAQHFRLAVSAAGGARLRAPTALHPDIPFFCFLLPRVALLPSFYRGCAAGFPARRGGCARRAHETLRVLFIIGKKQPRVKQNA